MKTLVLGMGNPILRDDRIGLRVIEELEALDLGPDVTLQKTTLAGLNLLENLIGFERAVMVDAIQTGGRPGAVYRLTPQDFITRQTAPHLHNLDFFQALTLGRKLISDLPEDVVIIAIEVADTSYFGEDMTPEVEGTVPLAVGHVLAILKEGQEFVRPLESAL